MKKWLLFFLVLGIYIPALFAKEDSLVVELVTIYPEPFHDFLKFEFKVKDTAHHIITIKISDNENGLVFYEKVPVYAGHETITVNTIDFFVRGFYSILVQTDRHHKTIRRYKRE